MTALLARWTEKLAGGPQAGTSDSPPLARVMGVVKQQHLRSQHLVVSTTVCPTHCSCATIVHLISASGVDEVSHMPVSKAGMRPGGLMYIILFEHGVSHYQI